MKVAIMKPHFLPYIGYWQLIHACDVFVLNDDVQYIRHAWINRNRILHPHRGWQYVILPLERYSSQAAVKEVRIHSQYDWKDRLVRQIEHYKKSAPYFAEARTLLQDALDVAEGNHLAAVNTAIIRKMCGTLGIERKLIVQSESGFDLSNICEPDDWSLSVTHQLGGDAFINPIGGAHLHDAQKFAQYGISLSFLKSRDIRYEQHRPFEASLSILDVLMFNGVERTRSLLNDYEIIRA